MTEHTTIDKILQTFGEEIDYHGWMDGDLPKAKLAITTYLQQEIDKARIDDLERLQESFGDRGIVTFDMPYDEEAEAVAIAHVLNRITDRIATIRERSQ